MQHGLDHHHPGAASEASRVFLVSLLVLTFLMNTVGRGVTETFAVFLLPVERGLGATRAEMTAAYSIFAVAYGFSAPFTGQLIDRFGARITYGFGLAVLGVGYALAGLSTSIWHYYVCVGLLGGLGAAALGMVIASSLLARWFTTAHRRHHGPAVCSRRRRHAPDAAADAGAPRPLWLAADASPAWRRRSALHSAHRGCFPFGASRKAHRNGR